ncbi:MULTISPECIES: LysR substrate-binding domain-containing protein [unclassified Leisingera]|uniref:LysR substrate-binding domain-containing protein n=1 Tax=unclassified Leisingera TaxID=2614906 RepID=UPI00031A7070|nr:MULTISPECIES: LysR substrate-binding domain-containing protein [unclassified Leisingera]KIC23841.1 transcriptional regulator [Leisingera sp. ANG-S3]KIC53352.1 transcriptional regulator [Leisingera sp. ANG-S]KID08198.1 transcriptional regulator [Leisingera sp. ANG1]
MDRPVNPLPPLPAVRVFEAAARLGSFSRAAEELAMTQAAVSYQVKLLEDRAGRPLFKRLPRGVEPTATGKALQRQASEALDLLRQGWAEVRGSSGEELVISTITSFAAFILAPRLGLFQVAHPGITTRVDVNPRVADLLAGEASVGIRVGRGNWPGLAADLLIRASYTPLLTPALMEAYGPIEEPADLLRVPLVDAGDPAWGMWFRAAGVAPPKRAERHSLGTQMLEVQAALAGQGACLMTPAYARGLIESGALVQPFDLVTEDDISAWLVYPEARRDAPAISAFRSWLLAEVAELAG